MQTYDYVFKYILVGDTGKSCLNLQFIENKTKMNHDITIGVEFATKFIKVKNKNVKLQIWDTAGQENFRSITKSYFKSAAGALLIYDISRRSSFTQLEQWINELREHGNQETVIIIIGNKCDKEEERVVSVEEGQKFAQKFNLNFIETSAVTAYNVNEVFQKLSEQIYFLIEDQTINIDNQNTGVKYGTTFKKLNLKPQQSNYCQQC